MPGATPSIDFAKNHAKVKKVEAEYDITESQRDAYFERFDTSFEKASQEMIDTYKSYVTMGEKIKPLQNTVSDAFNQIGDTNVSGTLPMWKRAFFKSADVIRRFSPLIARKLELHDFTRSFEMKGPGERRILEIKKIVKDKKVQSKYMHMIDPELAKNAVGQLKSLSENKKLTEVQRRRFKSEYVEALAAKTSFEVGGRYEKASEIWAETSKFYWESL